MTDHDIEEGPFFLKLLAENAVLTGTALKGPVTGKKLITKAILSVGKLYASQVPTFHGRFEGRELLQYDAVLRAGPSIKGVVVLIRDANGLVGSVSVSHSPLDGALALSKGLAEIFADDPELKDIH